MAAYERFMPPASFYERMAKDCRCCPECQNAPCDGVCAGGMCDEMCWCDDSDEDEDCDADE